MMTRNNNQLRWVRGNDVLLRLHVSEITHDSTTGEDTATPFMLSMASNLRVVLRNSMRLAVNATIALAEDDPAVVLIDIPGSTPSGQYSLELTCERQDRRVRSAESAVFAIVNTNDQANVVFERINGAVTTDLQLSIEYVTQAIARGKNVYELWLEAGNEGTLEDYLNTFWQPADATQEVSGLMSAADKQWLDQVGDIEVMTADQAADLVHGILNN